jgi:hypothetical protein
MKPISTCYAEPFVKPVKSHVSITNWKLLRPSEKEDI